MPSGLKLRLPKREVYEDADFSMNKEKTLPELMEALKAQRDHLNDVLDAIERRDMSSDQIKDYLRWVYKNMKEMRRSPFFHPTQFSAF